MPIETLILEVDRDLSPDELLSAVEEHRDKIKSLLMANLEYVSMRATCDGFQLDGVDEDDGIYTLRYSYDWSAFYGCKDADDGGSESDEIKIRYKDGNVTIEFDVKPERFPNDEL